MSFQGFKAITFRMVAYWVVTGCSHANINVSTGPDVSSFRAQGEGDMFLPNIVISLQDYTASHHRKEKSKINTYIQLAMRYHEKKIQ